MNTLRFGDGIEINATDERADLVQQLVDALNKKMLRLVDQSITSGTSMDDMNREFQEIAQEIGQLNRLIQAIQEFMVDSDEQNRKLQILSEIIEQKRQHTDEYDDTIVRQKIECIWIHPDGKAEIIFGGGKIIRQTAPLTACFVYIQNCVCQFSLAPFPISHPRIQGRYFLPLRVCQVRRVRPALFAFFSYASIIPLLLYENKFLARKLIGIIQSVF